jgi:hypothetical protein
MHPSEALEGPIASLAKRLFDGEGDIPDEERGRASALPEIAESDYRTPANWHGCSPKPDRRQSLR